MAECDLNCPLFEPGMTCPELCGKVVVCKGPPDCPLEDDAAVANQQAGCPMCRRIIIRPDGTETEYRKKPN